MKAISIIFTDCSGPWGKMRETNLLESVKKSYFCFVLIATVSLRKVQLNQTCLKLKKMICSFKKFNLTQSTMLFGVNLCLTSPQVRKFKERQFTQGINQNRIRQTAALGPDMALKVNICGPRAAFQPKMYFLKTIENIFFCNKYLQLGSFLK